MWTINTLCLRAANAKIRRVHAKSDKDLNPYDPPRIDFRFTPFHKRIWNAAKLAIHEYRAGLVRENFTHGEHVKAWLALAMIGFFLLFNVLGLTIGLLNFLGIH